MKAEWHKCLENISFYISVLFIHFFTHTFDNGVNINDDFCKYIARIFSDDMLKRKLPSVR